MEAADWGRLAALLATGAGAGFLATLFGVGGGILMVPMLVYVFGLPFPQATATSLVAITMLSPVAVWQHANRHAVQWRVGAWLALGGIPGVALGIWLEPRTPVSWLKVLLGGVMLGAAVRMAWAARPLVREPVRHWAVLAGLGAGAGLLSKLLGIGGGLVTVPALVFMGTEVHAAVGSSLVPVFTNAALASADKVAAGFDWLPALPLAAGAIATTWLGTRVGHGMEAGRLKRLFAALLVAAAVYVAGTSGAWPHV